MLLKEDVKFWTVLACTDLRTGTDEMEKKNEDGNQLTQVQMFVCIHGLTDV